MPANSYYLWYWRRWYWSSGSGGWREPNDGRRYPVVNIVIITWNSWDYAYGLGWEPLKDPPPDSPPDRVIPIKNMDDWQSHWDKAAPYKKLLVLEFYDKSSTVYKAMDKRLDELAEQYKGKAGFYKLDVDNFEFLARICGVEGAYPTFALFKNCKQVGKVVGLKEDELQRSIEQALD